MELPPNERRAFIQNLWNLTEMLDRNPRIPIPLITEITYHPHGGSDDERRAEIDRIAEELGEEPKYTANGEHYAVTRYFGKSVRYEAVMISDRAMMQFNARMSYSDNFAHITGREQTE